MTARRNSAARSTPSRRDFLKTAAAAASAAFAVPAIVPCSVRAANAPSKRLNVGFIGLGNQSTLDLPAFLMQDDVQVVAVADVNTASYGYKDAKQFLGRKPGQDRVNQYYAKNSPSGQYKGCDAYNDFREIIGRNDIDIVVLVVPDHWHALMTAMAAKAGKDIYCEKPCTKTIFESIALADVLRRTARVFQGGMQRRNLPHFAFAAELARQGKLGKLTAVHAHRRG
jgi:predicted dehydrogenase